MSEGLRPRGIAPGAEITLSGDSVPRWAEGVRFIVKSVNPDGGMDLGFAPGEAQKAKAAIDRLDEMEDRKMRELLPAPKWGRVFYSNRALRAIKLPEAGHDG